MLYIKPFCYQSILIFKAAAVHLLRKIITRVLDNEKLYCLTIRKAHEILYIFLVFVKSDSAVMKVENKKGPLLCKARAKPDRLHLKFITLNSPVLKL